MKKFLHWLFFIAIAISVSCTTERDDATPNPDPQEASGHKVSAEQALADLNALLPQLDGATRAGGRSVAGLHTVHSAQLLPATRGEAAVPDLEDLVYIANFEDGAGYAVLAADDRLPSILAIVDEGSLSPAQLVETARGEYDDPSKAPVAPGVVQYLLGFGSGKIAPLYIGGDKPPVVTDSTKLPTGPRYVYGAWKKTAGRLPIIQTKWGQWKPFNQFVSREHLACPVGCNAVATGQMIATMLYNRGRNISSIGNRTVNWSNMDTVLNRAYKGSMRTFESSDINTYSMEVANFLYGVGLELKTTYTPTGSSSSITNTCELLKKLKFNGVAWREYDSGTIYSMVTNQAHPVWVQGNNKDNEDVHSWVIDGTYRRTRTVEYYSGLSLISKYNQTETLFHCNFGYKGVSDGYYPTEVFDLSEGPLFLEPNYGDNEKFIQEFDFSYNKYYIYYSDVQ